MKIEFVFAVLPIFLLISLGLALIFHHSFHSPDQPAVLFCLLVLLISAFLFLFCAIDFTGMRVFCGYGFSI